jgi:transposase
MPKPATLSPAQHATITAALFRREDTSSIAKEHSISERQVRRIAQNLRNYGTVSAPRTKKMGRPNVLTKEIEDDLRDYVGGNPLALLSDMQTYISTKFEIKVSRASLSRRMKELGFTRGVVRRGAGAADPLPELSQVDYARLVNEEGINEGVLNGSRTKYAWLLDGQPVQRQSEMEGGGREKKRRGMVGSGKGHRDTDNSMIDTSNMEDSTIQPDLETAINPNHDVLGNVASLSEYAMPIEQQNDFAQRDVGQSTAQQQEYFQPLRQHLPPYLPPLERALQGVDPFQPTHVEYSS